MRSLKAFLLFALGFLLASGCSDRIGPPPKTADGITFGGPPPETAGILAAASQTAKGLEEGKPAAWVARFLTPEGEPRIDVDVIRAGTNCSWTFRSSADRKAGFALRIVQTNGSWVVGQARGVSRWKPYEARLEFLTATSFMAGSDLAFARPEFFEGARYFARRDHSVEYKVVMDAKDKSAAESLIRQFRKVTPELNEKQRETTESNVAKMKKATTEGQSIVVNAEFGFFENYPFLAGRVQISSFRWLAPDSIYLQRLAIDGANTNAVDHTATIANWPLDESVIVLHDPMARSEEERQPSAEPYLLNLRSGELRRVPFTGAAGFSACFLPDRRNVAVSSLDLTRPGFTKVNLATGQNTLFGYGQLRPGRIAFFAELSEDAKKLGYVETAWDEALLKTQLRWVDVQTGIASDFGKPLEMEGGFNWLPDGDGVVLVRNKPVKDMTVVPPKVIAVIRGDRGAKDLVEGDEPVVLRKSKRILYRSATAPYPWMTMDFDGNDRRLFANGFYDHVFPAVSPDESKIFFEKRVGERELQPHVFNLDGSADRRMTETKGYFGKASWR